MHYLEIDSFFGIKCANFANIEHPFKNCHVAGIFGPKFMWCQWIAIM
jgi:hypothetical protein